MIFKDNSITLEEAKDYFTKDIDEADRYIDLIIDIANANINNFYDSTSAFPPSGQVWGKLEKTTDGKGAVIYYDFIPSKLYEILSDNNINWDGIKKKMANKGYVVVDNQGKFQINTRINNITPIVIIKVVITIPYVIQTNTLALLSGSFINWSIGFLFILNTLS